MDTNIIMDRILDWFIKVLDVVMVIAAGALIVFVVVFLVVR